MMLFFSLVLFSQRIYSSDHYVADLSPVNDVFENTNKKVDNKYKAWLAGHPNVSEADKAAKKKSLLSEEMKNLNEEEKKAYNLKLGEDLARNLHESVLEDYDAWVKANPKAGDIEKSKKYQKILTEKYNALSEEDRVLVDAYLSRTTEPTESTTTYSRPSSSTNSKNQKTKVIVNYVDEHGKTSTEINEYGMIWLKESSDGSSAWYGIDNSDGTFKIGSKFWVKWLSPKIDRKEFEEYYNKLDDEHKNKVDKNNLWIFLTGVTDPDGNEYKNFYGNLNYYIQIGEDWNKDDINVVFISDRKDSILDVSYATLEYPEGKDEFAKVVMKHFSPYAVYDEDKDKVRLSNVSKSASIKTGEISKASELTLMIWISLFLVASLNRKQKNSVLS